MNFSLKAGIASAALVVAAATPVLAADLGGRGSMKDRGYVAPLPEVSRGVAGPCYFRADVGFSKSNSPTVNWPVSSETFTDNLFGDGTPANPFITESLYNRTFLTDRVTGTKIENTWLGEAGVGCGSGSYGIRGEAMLGYRGERKIDGKPGDYSREYFVNDFRTNPPAPAPTPLNQQVIDDPLHTTLKTYTLMFNAYKDLGNYGGFVPYVGAGIGAAYHQLGDVYFTENPFLTNRIKGANDLTFAWSLMAGVGYQLSDRAILDLGYRYIDLGKAASERVDSAGFVNPRVNLDDITAHEFKVGLRYHFGSDCCAQPAAYQPFK